MNSSASSASASNYNLRSGGSGPSAAFGSGNFNASIEKRPKLAGPQAHAHPDRSILSKARDVLEADDVFFKLSELEQRIDDQIVRKQNEIAASSFRSSKQRRPLKIYVSNTWSEAEQSSSAAGNDGGSEPSWILRIEGRIDQPTVSSQKRSQQQGSSPSSVATSMAPKKFSHFLKSVIVELEPVGAFPGEVIEWNRNQTQMTLQSDGFEIRRQWPYFAECPSLPCKIHLQFDFSPVRFRLAPPLADLLNLQLASRPAIVVALWQYIKLHKLQESDEKKIINNDEALQGLFHVPKMSFSDIPVLVEPYLLPPEAVTLNFEIKCGGDAELTNVLTDVLEIEVDVDDFSKGAPRAFLPAPLLRDLAFHEARVKELLDALRSSRLNHQLLAAFSQQPAATCQSLLRSALRDYETLIGDVPVTLDELKRHEFYESEAIEQAVGEFLSLNPRFLPF